MSKAAKVSVCFIVRNEEGSGLFEQCLESVRPHVEEIVILDTGSTDNTPAIARKYADVFEIFTDCNDPETGVIRDFSVARNRSFELARQKWVMWMDSDDILRGAENIAKLIGVAEHNLAQRRVTGSQQEWCYLFPYEYAYNATGQCVCLHYRERLLSKREAMRWVNPVHEVMIPTDAAQLIIVPCDDVVFSHQRQRSKKPQESGRNLRILQKFVETDGSQDARQFYYLGLEYANAGNFDKAIEWLSKYVGVSGWEDEATMAALKLAELAFTRGNIKEGISWGFRAIGIHELWGEGYFAVARGYYGLAMQGEAGGNVLRNWQKCAHFAKVGLGLPPTKTMLFVNPMERNHDIHTYYNMALSQIGDIAGALVSATEGLKAVPSDPNLKYNQKTFQRILAKQEISNGLVKLTDAEGISLATRSAVVAAIETDTAFSLDGWPTFDRPENYPNGVELKHFPVARATPHSRAWGIPATSDIDDLPVTMSDEQLEAATLLLWKEYLVHDEVLAAENLLKDAPYRVKHNAAIQKALEQTRGMTAWMDDYAEQQKWNSPADTTVECGVVLPGPLTGQLLDRSDLALQTISKDEKIIDFGCFDGGITNRWGLAGYNVTGVDLCETSVALANRKAEEFKTGAKHVVSKFRDLNVSEKYDLATCCDTYEHVKDHVNDLIAPARRTLKEDGRMILVTPHGSWMRGEFIEWAHPWRWAKDENRCWNASLPHAHLIAPTAWSVAEHFRSDGWWVKDSYVVESKSHQDVPGQGNIYSEALLKAPPCKTGDALDIIFACGDALQAWNPKIHRDEGIGGSETMVVEMAKRLSLSGHRVRVYTSTGKYGEGVFDGVEYHQSNKLPLAKKCDVFVAWRNGALLNAPVEAKVRFVWVHDIFAHQMSHRNILKADRVLTLSGWHKAFVEAHHNLPSEQVIHTRNGIDLSRFRDTPPRNPHRAVYSSSPDRGLPVLLKVWPEIRKQVPDAELRVFYGFFNWRRVAEANNDQVHLQAIAQLEAKLVELAAHGVTMCGKVDQRRLAHEFLSAGVWAYPTWFSETSCLTAMEAQAAGLRIVTSSIAALNETVGNEYGVLIDGDWTTSEYQAKFIEETVRAMTAPEGEWKKTREELQQRARRDFALGSLASDWDVMFRGVLSELQSSPLIPYKGRADFARAA